MPIGGHHDVFDATQHRRSVRLRKIGKRLTGLGMAD